MATDELGPFRGERAQLGGQEAGHWSRDEWMLMYMRGLGIAQIARVCRVPVKKVDASIRSRLRAEPWRRGRRLVLHDQPALPPKMSTAQRWEKRMKGLECLHARNARCPKATSSDKAESSLGYWIYTQRRRKRANRLTAEQLQRLDEIPGWYRPARGEDESRVWDERLEETADYVATYRRLPTYRKGKTDLRNVLAVWIWAQRRRHRDGTLPHARRERLDALIPGWLPID